MKKIYRRLGRYRMYLNRLQTYVSMVNFTMLLYLYITQSPLGLAWYIWILIMGIIFPVLVVFDVSLVYPGTLIYAYNKNPGFQKLESIAKENQKDIRKIMEHLKIENNE